MKTKLLFLVALILVVTGHPALCGADANLDFDVFVAPVTNQANGQKVEVTNLTKIEGLAGGEVLSECCFFFPAPAEKIVDTFSTPDGICAISAFCEGVKKIGPTADQKGWQGEMSIDLAKLSDESRREVWSPAAVEKIQQSKDKKYTARFQVTKEVQGDVTTIRFNLENGRLFSKLQITGSVHKGGPGATLIVLRAVSVSTLAEGVGDRVLLAKRLIRVSPKVLDGAFKSTKK